jgi:hypothetical protein
MTTDERRLSTSDVAAALDRREQTGARGPERVRDEHETEHDPGPSQPPNDAARTPLFADEELGGYRTRWSAIQTGFVDEPRKAVEQADALVAEAMKRLAEVFAEERGRLEAQWERNDRVSTEDLRLAMRRYRSFFERLLSV